MWTSTTKYYFLIFLLSLPLLEQFRNIDFKAATFHSFKIMDHQLHLIVYFVLLIYLQLQSKNILEHSIASNIQTTVLAS